MSSMQILMLWAWMQLPLGGCSIINSDGPGDWIARWIAANIVVAFIVGTLYALTQLIIHWDSFA